MYAFLTIVVWVIHGIIQSVLLWAPFVAPLSEPSYPPTWWYAIHSWSDWRDNLDHNLRPNSTFIGYYLRCAWWHMEQKVENIAEVLVAGARAYLLGRIGYIRHGFNSLGHWLTNVDNTLGGNLPSWAVNAIGGLRHLFGKFPYAIAQGWLAWGDIWESIKREVRDWALAFYANTVQFALDSISWLQSLGYQVGQWWINFSGWLTNFVQNPYGVIANALGERWSWLVAFWQNPVGFVLTWLSPWWSPLVTFARDCLTFYYNLWGSYASDLWDFLSDPMGYVGDRLETIIERYW